MRRGRLLAVGLLGLASWLALVGVLWAARQQAEPVPRVAKALHGISRSVDRPAGDVQDPVDV